jgi:citrate lyase subunit beta/citryl-CoA lyase
MQWIRSLLFVPANRPAFLEKSARLPADAFVLDLEDSVPPQEKLSAREMAAAHLRGSGTRNCWVRVNAALVLAEVAALAGLPRLAGFVLPKSETADEIRSVDEALTQAERQAGAVAGATKLMLTLETAKGVVLAYSLLQASPRIANAIFAGARDGDLMRDLGCEWSSDGPELMHARQGALLAMRAAGVLYPLDGVYTDLRDAAGFENDSVLSARLGYRGRTVIHPDQIAPANRLYAPRPEAVARYRRLLEAFEPAQARGIAAIEFEGRMIDEAMARNARRIVTAAEMFEK